MKRITLTETQLRRLTEGTNTAGVLEKTYIAYGASEYDPAKFRPVDPDNRWGIVNNKPAGGLWASPVDSGYGWADWCRAEEFNVKSLDKSFLFKLSPNAKIYTIDNIQDLAAVSTLNDPMTIDMGVGINVRELMENGYDGLYVTEYAANNLKYSPVPGLKDLYMWDVESICVFNKDVIIPL